MHVHFSIETIVLIYQLRWNSYHIFMLPQQQHHYDNGITSSLIRCGYFLKQATVVIFIVFVVLHSPRLARQLSWLHPLEDTFLLWRDC